MWQEFSDLRKEYLEKTDTNTAAYKNNTMITFLFEILRFTGNDLRKQEFSDMFASGKHSSQENMLKAYDLWQAYLFVQEKAAHHEKLTLELIQKIASKVMKHTGKEETTTVGRYDTSLGDFRLGEDYNETYPITDFRKIPEQLDLLCKEINTRIDKIRGVQTVRLAADSMYEMVHIKPFGYGNLETSLLLMNYIQLYHSEPLIIFSADTRPEFLNAIKRKKDSIDPENFENFVVRQQMTFFKRRLQELRRKKDTEN